MKKSNIWDRWSHSRTKKPPRWSAIARHRQELTSKSYLPRYRLHTIDAVVTPTTTYGAGTMDYIQQKKRKNAPHCPAQNVLSHHSDKERKYKKKNKEDSGGKYIQHDEMSEDTQEEDSLTSHIGRNTEETEMTTRPAKCHPKPRKMDQKSRRVEPWTCDIDEISKKSRKTSQDMEDDLNESVKDEATEPLKVMI